MPEIVSGTTDTEGVGERVIFRLADYTFTGASRLKMRWFLIIGFERVV